MIINITMTAIRRPELHERVLKSFCEKLLYPALAKDYKLTLNYFINLDPVPEDVNILDVREIFNKYIPLIRNKWINEKAAHFGRAFTRIWKESSKHSADFTFHLEDDWELLQPVDLLNLIRIMNKYPNLQILRLNSFASGQTMTKNWNKFIPWNGVFYEIPKNDQGLLGFTGHPSLIRQSFVNEVAPKLNPESNPEKQIKGKNKKFKHLFQDPYRYGVYGVRHKGPIVKDVGRKWMIDTGYRKKGSKSHFTEYIKVKEKK